MCSFMAILSINGMKDGIIDRLLYLLRYLKNSVKGMFKGIIRWKDLTLKYSLYKKRMKNRLSKVIGRTHIDISIQSNPRDSPLNI